jgi:hypothetical protein
MREFKPYPKEKSTGRKKHKSATYKCSNGQRINQAQIDSKLRKTYQEMGVQRHCSAYPDMEAHDHDHTISQARCKQLGKTELIWDPDNIEFSSRTAHQEWERYRSGRFEEHKNVVKRMLFVKKHDREKYWLRIDHISTYTIIKELQKHHG